MKLFSAELLTSGEERAVKAVVLRKKRFGYTLLQHYITEPENLKSLSGDLPVSFCIEYFDTITETLNIPPVKDARTFRMLAGNKLKDSMTDGISYLLAYKHDERAQSERRGSEEYRVYMVPESLFDEDAGLSEKQKTGMSMFTLSDLALCGISDFFFPDEVVFHAFADDQKVVVTVSRGRMVVYTRTMEYAGSAGQAAESIFYETINLTYMFVTKNLHIDVDKMILSGRLTEEEGLSQMLFDFNSKPQVSLLHDRFVRGCSRKTFMDFLIPISLCALDDSYDFTPERYREIRGFNMLKSAANLLAVLAVAVLLLLNLSAFGSFMSAKQRLAREVNSTRNRVDRCMADFRNSGKRRYGFYYYSLLKKASDGAFALYGDTSQLLDVGKFDNVLFRKNKNGTELDISGKSKFDSYAEMDAYRVRLNGIISRLSGNDKFRIKDSSRYDSQVLAAYVHINVFKRQK